jgi:ribosome-associated protein
MKGMSDAKIPVVKIRGDLITLGQLVKLLRLIGSGGEVKDFLANAKIKVNGEPEDRRGRKIRDGDIVHIPGKKTVRIEATPEAEPPAEA